LHHKKTLSLYIIWVIYANPELLKWFTDEFPHSSQKLDMGKKVAFDSKKADQIFDLIPLS
jgi:hypothetical protein